MRVLTVVIEVTAAVAANCLWYYLGRLNGLRLGYERSLDAAISTHSDVLCEIWRETETTPEEATVIMLNVANTLRRRRVELEELERLIK